MSRLFHNWERLLASGPLRGDRAWLFERLIYLWFLCQWLYFLPIQELLWGPGSVFNRPSWPLGGVNSVFYGLLYNRSLDDVVIGAHVVAVVLALFGLGRWVSKAAVYLTGFMLYYAAWPVYNGGSMLMLMYAFFAIFMRIEARSPGRMAVSNLGVLAAMLQLILVYAVAALYKWFGCDWLHGVAVHKSLYQDAYAYAWPRELLGGGILVVALNYFGLAYQTLFPILVWCKGVKKWLLLAGVGFHLFICVGMRIPDFGTAMLVGYVLFMDESWARRVRRAAQGLRVRLLSAKT